MRFLFLIKAGPNYGWGHYTRSKSLALSLLKKGHYVTFWVVGSSIDLRDFFSVKEIHNHKELASLEEILIKEDIDVLYVDGHFDFDKELFDQQTRSNVKIVFYHNLSISKSQCDVYICPYPDDSRIDGIRNLNKVQLYEGFEYYIIRDEVIRLARTSVIKELTPKIAITVGGSDPNFILERICKNINFEAYKHFSFTLLIGSSFNPKRVIELKHSCTFSNVKFEQFSLKEIVASDFVVSALGVSVFEQLFLGKPVACIPLNESADSIGQFLSKEKLAINLGVYNELKTGIFDSLLDRIKRENSYLQKMGERAKKIIDGKGSERITAILENLN